MEHQLWKAILAALAVIDKRPKRTSEDFSDEDIVKTWFWGVLHDRSVRWSCQRCNWPVYERHRPRPSSSTMSRRLRHPAVRRLLDARRAGAAAPRTGTIGLGP